MTPSRISDEQACTLLHCLKSARCSVCGKRKNPKHPLCKSCYFSLPEELRAAMGAVLAGDFYPDDQFFEQYQAAKDHLFRLGYGRTQTQCRA